MNSLVVNLKMFEKFVDDVMPPLAADEVYFVSMSARNKYLSPEERDYYQLGRTEMFGRTLCSGDWYYAMSKLAAVLTYRNTKAGLKYPEKALVVYVNVNPSSSVKACSNFANIVTRIQGEMVASYMAGNTPNEAQLLKGDRLLMNEYQKATGTRHYVDIDIDAPKEYAQRLNEVLSKNGVDYWVVQTRGGYHFMVKRESLNKAKFPLHQTVKELDKEAKSFGGEVMFNGNAMVAMPGTLQGGHLVTVFRGDELC